MRSRAICWCGRDDTNWHTISIVTGKFYYWNSNKWFTWSSSSTKWKCDFTVNYSFFLCDRIVIFILRVMHFNWINTIYKIHNFFHFRNEMRFLAKMQSTNWTKFPCVPNTTHTDFIQSFRMITNAHWLSCVINWEECCLILSTNLSSANLKYCWMGWMCSDWNLVKNSNEAKQEENRKREKQITYEKQSLN